MTPEQRARSRSLSSSPGFSQATRAGGGATSTWEGALLRFFLRTIGNPPVAIGMRGGEAICTADTPPLGTVRIGDRRTLLRLMYNAELEFGEAYVDGRLEVEGDLVRMLGAVYGAPVHPLAAKLLRRSARPRANSIEGSRHNIHRHYDLGNAFYQLWLDERLLYTCAYFPTPDTTLEAAQVAKMEHVCRKAFIRPGDRVVEAGCGWGALALYMAKERGASVRAFNISHEQIAYAREQAERQGLAGRVEFIEDDYRNVSGSYDVFMSVGMLEHVGVDHYRDLGRVMDRCLPVHGRGLIHSIGRNRPLPLNPWVEKHIFPGAYPPTLREMTEIFEPCDFSVLDVENLRLHYARTLEHWLQRYERAVDRVAQMFDARFVRSWRLYLAGSIAAFRASSLQLFQVAFARARNNEIPWTRAYLYQ